MLRVHNEHFLESAEFPFSLVPYRLDKGGIVPPHCHEFIEFVYVAEGTGYHEYRGSTYRISEGDVFVIEPETVHSYRAETAMLFYNVLFLPGILAAELAAMAKVTPFVDFFYVEPFLRHTVQFQAHLILQADERLQMRTLLGRLEDEYESKNAGYRTLVKTKLLEIFVFLSRCYDNWVKKPLTTLTDEQKVMRHVCDFIRLHCGQPLTLPQVSQLCGMSHAAFTAKFKQHTDMTFIEFRNAARTDAACKQLAESEDKILQVALDAGFEDVSFFNKMFKKNVGVTPREYRELYRRNMSPTD
ncbi:AraC family transcriptional regulator [Cohnella soli]|uniref:AraC family transcriptional regulator n=1 Tax=Cohnella soli TaxID=425005 RepID=A0ABW0HYC6_9BACL